MFEIGDKVRCMMSNKDGIVVRNKAILGFKKTMAIQVKFDDDSNQIYISDKCECLILRD